MHLNTVKTAADLPFKGIELIKVDKAITEIVIGGKLRIRRGESYNNHLVLLVEAPFEQSPRYRVTATIDGFDPKVSYFEHQHEANAARADFEAKGAVATVEKLDVLIDDAGDVVAAANEPQPVAADDELIPF